MYCMDACNEGWSTSRSFWNKNMTVAQTREAKIGKVWVGSVMTFFLTGNLAKPIMMREKRYRTIYVKTKEG